jgi:hypothetical protein
MRGARPLTNGLDAVGTAIGAVCSFGVGAFFLLNAVELA